ncbi:MAG: hypothetical protein DA330_03175 [Nitrososphaera sp.]|nr:hypothetical protein [Nitrososphaera sp.]
MKFEYEEFDTLDELLLYLASITPYGKQVMPISSYKDYIFSIIPLSPLTGEVMMMVYTKGKLDPGLVEFDVSSRKHRVVTSVERADKNYFIVLTPKLATLADEAINGLP